MKMISFEYDSEELAFWRDLASRLWYGQGRLTADASMDFDYAWDLLKEYFEGANDN